MGVGRVVNLGGDNPERFSFADGSCSKSCTGTYYVVSPFNTTVLSATVHTVEFSP